MIHGISIEHIRERMYKKTTSQCLVNLSIFRTYSRFAGLIISWPVKMSLISKVLLRVVQLVKAESFTKMSYCCKSH